MRSSANAEAVACQPDLCDDVWTKVFEYLPLDDRHSIRLSCRRFYDICNSQRFLKDEKIVFCGNVNSMSAISCFVGSRRKQWNLGFFQVDLMDDSGVRSFFEVNL